MPNSPQKSIQDPAPLADSSDDSDIEGLLEKSYPELSVIESQLLLEVSDFFTSFGALLSQVEEIGGRALSDALSQNERISVKIKKYQEKREEEGTEECADYGIVILISFVQGNLKSFSFSKFWFSLFQNRKPSNFNTLGPRPLKFGGV